MGISITSAFSVTVLKESAVSSMIEISIASVFSVKVLTESTGSMIDIFIASVFSVTVKEFVSKSTRELSTSLTTVLLHSPRSKHCLQINFLLLVKTFLLTRAAIFIFELLSVTISITRESFVVCKSHLHFRSKRFLKDFLLCLVIISWLFSAFCLVTRLVFLAPIFLKLNGTMKAKQRRESYLYFLDSFKDRSQSISSIFQYSLAFKV